MAKNTITVGELIKILSDYCPDTPVHFASTEDVYDIGNANDYDETNTEALTLYEYQH